MDCIFNNGEITVNNVKNYNIDKIFDCGQCFRFDKNENGEWTGIASGKFLTLSQKGDSVKIKGISKNDYDGVFRRFLCLDCEYDGIMSDISTHFTGDETMTKAMSFGDGIRILRQDGWEAICSFIISQNNNIPRIKKLVAEISRRFGEQIDDDKYAFPTASALAEAGEDAIFDCKTGFRAKYIYDAARKVAGGETDIASIYKMDTQSAIEYLEKIKGIGLKVASCALLFGFEKLDAFPIDVWMKRIIHDYYNDALDINTLGDYAGIAQQYLFYYIRYNGNK